MHNLTELAEWQTLAHHYQQIAHHQMKFWFNQDPLRSSKLILKIPGLSLDYSRNRINSTTLALLFNLAQAVNLREKIHALFSGQPINTSERRAALHTALRDFTGSPLIMNQENISLSIQKTKQHLYQFVEQIHQSQWKGSTGKAITDIVNIGIGGSYLGPMMSTRALKDFAVTKLKFHFISSVDPDHCHDILTELNPETTLFIISSKSFTTLETITNFHQVVNWMQQTLGSHVFQQHVIAVTANVDKAVSLGIPVTNIFPIWDWIGGRYSIWSAIGLPLMLMIGKTHFENFLKGGFDMDQHFFSADFSQNMPVIMGLLAIWYINFFNTTAQAIIPYSYRLRYLPSYLQQTEMESNGKSISTNGKSINYLTSPIVFGEEGCNGQHAYHQLLHQGTHLVPVDFILPYSATDAKKSQKNILLASAISQAEALLQGANFEQIYETLLKNHTDVNEAKELACHQIIPGNRPSNVLCLEQLSPYTLGKVLALYEHKVYVQASIWNINSFDQWGVELGKKLLPTILEKMHTQEI